MMVDWAKTPLQKMMGLMFQKKLERPLVLVLGRESRVGASIHMMFMRFPIDAVFLDTEKKVVDKVTLKPWALNYTPKKAAKYVVEMKVGTAKCKVGDKVVLE